MRSICAVVALFVGYLVVTAPAGVLRADDTPPSDLHFIDGHWTAWNPPGDLPSGAPVHVVVRGDTLWDLAASNLGNPYLWPQIWEKNQYVLDAHWIYPGDPIVLGVSVEPLQPTEIVGGAGRRANGGGAALETAVGGAAVGSTPGVASSPGAGGSVSGGMSGGGGPASGGTSRGGGTAGGGYQAGGSLPGGGDLAEAVTPGGGSPDPSGVPGVASPDAGAGTGVGRATGYATGSGLEEPLLVGGAAGDTFDGLDIETVGEGSSSPQAFGYESDLYCSGFIGELDERLPIGIAGSEHQAYGPSLTGRFDPHIASGEWGDLDTTKYGLDLGDIVYLDSGRSEGLAPGDLLSVVEPRQKVRHPMTNSTVGRLYVYLGRVRVLTVEAETSIAEIAHACDPIPVGSRLRPFQAEPVPLGRRTESRPPNDPTPAAALESAPVILLARDGLVSLGEDHLVFIDRGAESDATPGDVYTIYRLNREGFPPVPIGELAVLSVNRRTSLARILSSRLPIFIGDRLERK